MVYKYTDIIGTSNTDITDAVNNAFKEARKNGKEYRMGRIGSCHISGKRRRKNRIPSGGQNWF